MAFARYVHNGPLFSSILIGWGVFRGVADCTSRGVYIYMCVCGRNMRSACKIIWSKVPYKTFPIWTIIAYMATQLLYRLIFREQPIDLRITSWSANCIAKRLSEIWCIQTERWSIMWLIGWGLHSAQPWPVPSLRIASNHHSAGALIINRSEIYPSPAYQYFDVTNEWVYRFYLEFYLESAFEPNFVTQYRCCVPFS